VRERERDCQSFIYDDCLLYELKFFFGLNESTEILFSTLNDECKECTFSSSSSSSYTRLSCERSHNVIPLQKKKGSFIIFSQGKQENER
jgi:hypothetical protein